MKIVKLTYCKGWALLHLESLFSQDESFSIGQICDQLMIFSFALCQSWATSSWWSQFLSSWYLSLSIQEAVARLKSAEKMVNRYTYVPKRKDKRVLDITMDLSRNDEASAKPVSVSTDIFAVESRELPSCLREEPEPDSSSWYAWLLVVDWLTSSSLSSLQNIHQQLSQIDFGSPGIY